MIAHMNPEIPNSPNVQKRMKINAIKCKNSIPVEPIFPLTSQKKMVNGDIMTAKNFS